MDYDQPAAGSMVPSQRPSLGVNRNSTDERIEAEAKQPAMSHPTSTPHEQTGLSTDHSNTPSVPDSEMMDDALDDVPSKPQSSLAHPPLGPASHGTQHRFGQLTYKAEPNNAQPNHAGSSGTRPGKSQPGDAQRTYDDILKDLDTAVRRGDGDKTATLIRDAIDKKAWDVLPSQLSKKEKKALRSGDAVAQRRQMQRRKGRAVKTVSRVVMAGLVHGLQRRALAGEDDQRAAAIVQLARKHAASHARAITKEAYTMRQRSVNLDLVAREEARGRRVFEALQEKVRVTEELRARLEELGDGMIPPRSDYAVDDTMMICYINDARRREMSELNRHLRHFEGGLNGGQAASNARTLARRAEKRGKKQDDMNNLMDGMSKMSGLSWPTADNDDEAHKDDEDEADEDDEAMDMIM